MLLIAYDGSENADAAVDTAAELMAGAEAVILTTWEPYIDLMARNAAIGFGTMTTPYAGEIDKQVSDRALEVAEQGAARATAAGLRAQARSESSLGGPAQTILAIAEELDASAIIVGTRGLGRVKSLVLGSVSHSIVQHADRPVLVIPHPAEAH